MTTPDGHAGAIVRSKAARQAAVIRTVTGITVRNQAQLAEALTDAGYDVTQATLSRDLDELGAVKVRHADGGLVYVVPGHGGDATQVTSVDAAARNVRLARRCADLVLSAQASANLVIVRTPPGAAQFLAAALDQADRSDIVGTIAGDDAVLVVAQDPFGGAALAAHLIALAGSPRSPSQRPRRPESPQQSPGSGEEPS